MDTSESEDEGDLAAEPAPYVDHTMDPTDVEEESLEDLAGTRPYNRFALSLHVREHPQRDAQPQDVGLGAQVPYPAEAPSPCLNLTSSCCYTGVPWNYNLNGTNGNLFDAPQRVCPGQPSKLPATFRGMKKGMEEELEQLILEAAAYGRKGSFG